jgi:hypothetical protein
MEQQFVRQRQVWPSGHTSQLLAAGKPFGLGF